MVSRKSLYFSTFRDLAESPEVTRNRNAIKHNLYCEVRMLPFFMLLISLL